MREGTSRALELVVAILLAAATITAGIGVYRSSNHQGAAVWWAACACVFVLAVLVSVFALLVHPLFRRRRLQDSSEQVAATTRQPTVAGQAWLEPKELGKYLDEINRTMEEHGFGRNPNLLEPSGGTRDTVDRNPRETYRAALIGKGMDVRRVLTSSPDFDSPAVASWLSEAQTYLYVEGSGLANAELVAEYIFPLDATKAVDATLEALRQLGVKEVPF